MVRFPAAARAGCPDAHFYDSASVIHHAKASLIGQIVAHKAESVRKGRLLHKAAMASPLWFP